MRIINQSPIVLKPPSSVDDFLYQSENDVTSALDELAPLKCRTKPVATRSTARWLSEELMQLKKTCLFYVLYRKAGRAPSKSIKSDQQEYYQREFLKCTSADSKLKWRMFNELLHSRDRTQISSDDGPKLAASFTEFFTNKLGTIAGNIKTLLTASASNAMTNPSPSHPSKYPSFTPLSVVDVDRMTQTILDKSFILDIIPTSY